MRTLAALVLATLPGLAGAQVCNPVCATQPAQCCNIPQAAPFIAYESNVHGSTIFRGIGSQTPGDCSVVTDIDTLASPVKMPLAPVPVTLGLPGGGSLAFSLQQLVERWTASGGPLDGAACFSLRAPGFKTPAGPFEVVDGCGTHLIAIEGPAFFCVAPTLQVICFQERNLNSPPLPLPPGFDRAEDVCIAFQ